MLKGEENEKQQGASEAASTGDSGSSSGSVGGKKTAWVAPLKAESPEKERASQDGDKELDGLCDALDKVEVRTGDDEAVEKPFSVVDDIEKEEYEREEKGRKEQTKEAKGRKGGKAGKKSTTYSLYSSPTKQPPQQQQPEPKMTTKKDFKVPREWASYSKCGEVVPTTPFLPFKTPLSEERFARHPELEEHSIITLIQDLSARGIRLRTVIDLTLPFFYETEFLEAFDIKYEKIRIDNQEPRWHQVKRFLEICDEFADEQFKRKQEWDERQRERKEQGLEEEYYMYEVLGVHCTRGVNRTGYMICRAMIERMNYTAEHAVKLFNQARGHEMTEFFPELKRAEEKKRSFDRRGAGRGRGGGEAYRGGRGGANSVEGGRGGGNEGCYRGEEGRGGGEGGYRGARGGGSGGSDGGYRGEGGRGGGGGYRGGRGGGSEGYRSEGGSEGGYRGGRGGGYSGGEGGYRGGRGTPRGRGQ